MKPAAGKKPVGRKAAARKAVLKKPVAGKPVTQKAAATKPAGKKVAARKPAAKPVPKKKPAAGKTVARKKPVAARKPVTKKKSPGAPKARALPRPRLQPVDALDTVPSPPSSLGLDRHRSAARSGREERAHHLTEQGGMGSDITAGDMDTNVEDAYFTGDEAPGGDNPAPDMEVVEEIGRALGVEYQDNEELRGSDKLVERDKHRWELDPASAEDYLDHDRD